MREREVNTWQGDQTKRVDNTLPNLRTALEQLKPKLEAMGVVRIIGGAEAYAKGISPGLQIILDDSINSIALIKLEVQYSDGRTDEIFVEAWNDPKNHLSGAATPEVFVQRIKDALNIEDEESIEQRVDAFNWEEWANPSEKLAPYSSVFTTQTLLKEGARAFENLEIRMTEQVDGNDEDRTGTFCDVVYVNPKTAGDWPKPPPVLVARLELPAEWGQNTKFTADMVKSLQHQVLVCIDLAKANQGKPIEGLIEPNELPGL